MIDQNNPIPLIDATIQRLKDKYPEKFANFKPKPVPASKTGAESSTDKEKPKRPKKQGEVVERCIKYLATIPPAISGQGGHPATMYAARVVVYGFDLGAERGLQILLDHYNPRCEPEWSEAELRHKCNEADTTPFGEERGWLLNASNRTPIDPNCPDIPADYPGMKSDQTKESESSTTSTEQKPQSQQTESKPAPTANSSNTTSGPHQLRNWRLGTDKQGNQTQVGRSLVLVARDLFTRSGGWPKMVGEHMIVPGRRGESHQWIGSYSDLFAWLQLIFPGDTVDSPVDWGQGGDKSTKEEFFRFLRNSACERYHTLELYPHYPAIPGVLYLHPELPEPTGKDLRAFISQFVTAGPEDDDLLRAALFTLLWGGPPGKRPGVLFAAPGVESGVGSGKSTVAQKLSEVVGGALSCASDSSQLVTRLLSKNAVGYRVVLLDNLKSLHFSNMDLEGMMTSPNISGRALYQGDGSRPNLMTWMITVNDPSLSKDMAQRFIPIYIQRAKYSATWDTDTDAMIRERRWHIIADAIAEMKAEPQPLTNYTRYGPWNGDVLSKIPFPDALVELIKIRQCEADDDASNALAWVTVIEQAIQKINCDPETDRIFFSCPAMFKVLEAYAERGKGMNWVLKTLYKMKIPNLEKMHARGYRGLVWNPHLDIKKEINYEEKREKIVHRFIPE